MRLDVIGINDNNIDKISYLNSISSGISNRESRNRMKTILKKAIGSELTEIQKYCFVEHYINQRKGKEIAHELGVNPSTVSRHISAARKKLKNIASYYS